jgi:hypothetical protein
MMNARPFIRLLFGLLLAGALSAESPELDLSLGAEMDNAHGLDWVLPDGGTVHLRIIDRQFHLFFLDEERKIVEPLVPSVILRGEEARNKTNEVVRLLRRGRGPFLVHPRHHFPPHDYWLRLVIPDASGEEGANETLPRKRFRQ